MDETGALTAEGLPILLAHVHDRLRRHRTEIDEINVFPVPDTDTGSNLVATVACAVDALEASEGDGRQRARAAVDGALRGARGNSGVILSQLLRALGEALADGPIGPARLSGVLARATELAYDGVAHPVEGTMLTVLRRTAECARAMTGAQELAAITGAIVEAATTAVSRTTEQLEVLRTAGVVDAGARGLEVVFAAMDEHVGDRQVELRAVARPGGSDGGGREGVGSPDTPHTGAEEARFEVQYLLEVADAAGEQPVAADLRRRLSELGESVVVVTSSGLVRVHVHTDRVEDVVEAGRRHGAPDHVRVVSLAEEPPSDCWSLEPVAARSRPPRQLGVVAVVSGSGLVRLAAEAGAKVVQPLNGRLPDVRAILGAVDATGANAVMVLPGHPGVVPAAERAASVASEHAVTVVPSADSAPSVLAALAVFDPRDASEAAATELERVAAAVLAGEVVPAGGEHEAGGAPGALRAVLDGEQLAVTPDPLEALERILERAGGGREVVTLVVGEEVDGEQRDRAERLVRRLAGDAEVVVLDGGQPHVPYVVGLE